MAQALTTSVSPSCKGQPWSTDLSPGSAAILQPSRPLTSSLFTLEKLSLGKTQCPGGGQEKNPTWVWGEGGSTALYEACSILLRLPDLQGPWRKLPAF